MKYLNINSIGKMALSLMILIVLTANYANSVLGIPSALSTYLIYFFAYFLFACVIIRQVTSERSNTVIFHVPFWEITIILMLIYILISGLVRSDIYSVVYYIGSFLVGYATFCGTVLFLDKNKAGKIYNVVFLVLILHLILSYYQSSRVLKVDNIGGIFGTNYGITTTSHAFIELATLLFLAGYIKNKVKWYAFYSVLCICLLVAAIAELKMYYFAIFVYLLFYMFFSKNYKKAVLMILIMGGLFFAGMNVLIAFNPIFADFFSVDGIKGYLSSGYGGKTFAVTRTNGYSFIFENLFDKSYLKVLLGNGFAGNQAELFNEYNVSFFSYAKIFYLGGIVCTILYYALPASVAFKYLRESSDDFQLFSALVGIAFFIFAFYDSGTVSLVSGALYFFSLALGMAAQIKDDESSHKSKDYGNNNVCKVTGKE